jgi:Cu-processing system permease protein
LTLAVHSKHCCAPAGHGRNDGRIERGHFNDQFLFRRGSSPSAAALAITGASVWRASWYAFASMLGTSIMLGAVFVAIGYLISSLVRDRGTAAGLSVGIWLLMVLVLDMALLGILVIDQGRIISAPVLEGLLFLNPTDLYRLTNLTGFNVSQFSGMAGPSGTATTGMSALLLVLLIWIVAPLGLATTFFARREL